MNKLVSEFFSDDMSKRAAVYLVDHHYFRVDKYVDGKQIDSKEYTNHSFSAVAIEAEDFVLETDLNAYRDHDLI